MNSRREFLTGIAAGAIAAALPRPAAQAVSPGKGRPNIVFIEADDLTYKYLGCFGSKVVKTRHIDALAKRGVVFSNSVCQGMMCGPSRNSLITGLYPHNLGFYVNGQMRSLPKGIWAFPGALQRAGYHTALIGKSHFKPYADDAVGETPYEKRANAHKQQFGFDHVTHSLGRAMLGSGANAEPGKDAYVDHLLAKGLYKHFREEYPNPSTLPEDDYEDGFFTATACRWLRSYKQSKPLFLWLTCSCPHGPYDVPQKYLDLYRPEDMPEPIEDSLEGIPQELGSEKRKRSQEWFLEARAKYAGAVTFLDKQVGRIIDCLRKTGKLDNTVVVFFGDQGFQLGDHGLHGKGTLFKESLNASLIISCPTAFAPGRVVTEPVELLDLVKTCLDLAGSPEVAKRPPYGYSLVPLLTGKGRYQRDNVAFGEIEGFYAAVTERYKYIANEKQPILFDLEKDPDELHNVIGQNADIGRQLQQAVDTWLAETGPVVPSKKKRASRER